MIAPTRTRICSSHTPSRQNGIHR